LHGRCWRNFLAEPVALAVVTSRKTQGFFDKKVGDFNFSVKAEEQRKSAAG
jgi:hypothetical protein